MVTEMTDYDFLILGGGGTGLAAAMYGARLGLKTLVLGSTYGTELPIGGVITTTNIVENYPGFIKITGPQLAKNLEDHARSYKLVTIKNERASDVKKLKNCFVVKTEKTQYQAKTILFATGTKWKKLDIPVLIAKGISPEKMNEFYNKLKIFISLPPKAAGSALSWMEAMAAGVPIIVGNNYGEGFNFPIDKIECLSDIENTILNAKEKDYRKWLIENNFSWKTHVNKLIKVFKKR